MTPIRAWRQHLGLTQSEVARAVAIARLFDDREPLAWRDGHAQVQWARSLR